jgi:hypothetical protein
MNVSSTISNGQVAASPNALPQTLAVCHLPCALHSTQAELLRCWVCRRWVFNTVRGIDDEPVTPKDKVG